MVGEHDVGHVLRPYPELGKWREDRPRFGDQPWVHDQDHIAVSNHADGGGYAMIGAAQVALEQDVDSCRVRSRGRLGTTRIRSLSGWRHIAHGF
jgi:hypothetical protein